MKLKQNAIGRLGVPIAIASMFAIAQPASADNEQSSKSSSTAKRSSEMQQLTGEVIGKKQVNVPEQYHNASVVMIRTEDGRRALVDLGSAVDPQLRRVNIDIGDKISARGQVIPMGIHQVMVAEQLSAEGQSIRIDRRAQRQASQDSRRSQQQVSRTRQVTGTIMAMKQYYVEGIDKPLTLVQLRTDEGRSAIVNLGWEENPRLREADVRLGERIAARGNVVRMGNTAVLAANQLRSDGQTYQLDPQQAQKFDQARSGQRHQSEQREQSAQAGRQQSQDQTATQNRSDREWETIRPDISSRDSSLGSTQSMRTQSGIPLPQGSPFAGTVEMASPNPVPVVKELQKALIQRGYNPGPIDGKLDENTREALKAFQQDAGLEVTGTLNPATAEELGVKTAASKQVR